MSGGMFVRGEVEGRDLMARLGVDYRHSRKESIHPSERSSGDRGVGQSHPMG